MRGATSVRPRPAPFRDISIHAPREGCDTLRDHARRPREISIHAPREGCDRKWVLTCGVSAEFQSTHPVRGATHKDSQSGQWVEFQSTHPVRGATSPVRMTTIAEGFQSTHPVRGATTLDPNVSFRSGISIHAPREGCDWQLSDRERQIIEFQSTHPVRGATVFEVATMITKPFQSTHPVRGATTACANDVCATAYFNPRTP